jgi:hypothetical protein
MPGMQMTHALILVSAKAARKNLVSQHGCEHISLILQNGASLLRTVEGFMSDLIFASSKIDRYDLKAGFLENSRHLADAVRQAHAVNLQTIGIHETKPPFV